MSLLLVSAGRTEASAVATEANQQLHDLGFSLALVHELAAKCRYFIRLEFNTLANL